MVSSSAQGDTPITPFGFVLVSTSARLALLDCFAFLADYPRAGGLAAGLFFNFY
jgi:hypothetical protein